MTKDEILDGIKNPIIKQYLADHLNNVKNIPALEKPKQNGLSLLREILRVKSLLTAEDTAIIPFS